MSKLFVDQVDPKTATTLTLGTSGDTVSIPTGVGLTATDEVKTNKISPASGTAFTLGDSGDTFTVPSGVTFANSGTATGFGDTSYYVKITNVNGTNSVGDISINDCFSTTYRTYLVTFQFENDRGGNQIWMRFQADDDSTFDSNYRYACHQTNDGGTESTRVSTGDTKWIMTGGTGGGNSSIFGGCFGFMYVHNPYTIATGEAGAGNIYRCGWNAQYNEYDDSGHVVNSVATGMLEQNSYNVAGLRFLPSANYVEKRNVTVWGLKEY